jgi:hypothetical protein
LLKIHQSDKITSRKPTFPDLQGWTELPDRPVISANSEIQKKKNLGLDVGEVPKSLANIQTLNFYFKKP